MAIDTAVKLKSLSTGRRKLAQLMQELNFGRINDLPIRGGEPVLNPLPECIREIKFCSENGPRPESSMSDFALKAQVVELFTQFDAMRDATIGCLVIKHGLPFSMNVHAAT